MCLITSTLYACFNKSLFFLRLYFSSCGPAQWRLNGPDADPNAYELVKKVPDTLMMNLFGLACVMLILLFLIVVFNHPLMFTFLGVSYFFLRKLLQKNNN